MSRKKKRSPAAQPELRTLALLHSSDLERWICGTEARIRTYEAVRDGQLAPDDLASELVLLPPSESLSTSSCSAPLDRIARRLRPLLPRIEHVWVILGGDHGDFVIPRRSEQLLDCLLPDALVSVDPASLPHEAIHVASDEFGTKLRLHYRLSVGGVPAKHVAVLARGAMSNEPVALRIKLGSLAVTVCPALLWSSLAPRRLQNTLRQKKRILIEVPDNPETATFNQLYDRISVRIDGKLITIPSRCYHALLLHLRGISGEAVEPAEASRILGVALSAAYEAKRALTRAILDHGLDLFAKHARRWTFHPELAVSLAVSPSPENSEADD